MNAFSLCEHQIRRHEKAQKPEQRPQPSFPTERRKPNKYLLTMYSSFKAATTSIGGVKGNSH